MDLEKARRRPCCTEASHIYLQISLFFFFPIQQKQVGYPMYVQKLLTYVLCGQCFITYVSLAMSLTT